MKQLEALKTRAPKSLAPRVLLETGLADGYVSVAGPAGEIKVAFNERGVSAVHLGSDGAAFEDWFEDLQGRPAFPVEEMPKRLGAQLAKTLETGRLGTLSIDWSSMSEFQQAVLRKTAEILPGQVRPYSWVAREIGKPKAVRAVGTALARNPVPVLVPCHRVVRNDGHLGNYYYGTEVKSKILASEGMDVDGFEDLADRGVRLTGSDTTNIFCNPTCGHARRTQPNHTVEFRSAAEARQAGYRPCKVCRPVAA
ncbi:MAG: methylated-DNA--[protein]-cysteine S-methyltransferase [Acidimicrobiia bacterium]|nr:methylated-DNA--[protein]-cysteine S-methyltransferase [Acidimicrobiia bacterium]